MTSRVLSFGFSLTAAAAAVFAQGSAAGSAQRMAAAPANPISTSQAKVYSMLSGVVIAAAEKMPEENYAFRPADDVRSFGQLVGHLADSQYYFCSQAAGESQPATNAEKTKTGKAELVAALKEAVGYCNKVYGAMTDAKGSEMAKLMNFDVARITLLSANTAHDYEHYGNMSTYMRMKKVIPPTSEKSAGAEKGPEK
jgi:uncharacterized damage-inducible protein DinB